MPEHEVQIVRSRRRTRTVSVKEVDGVLRVSAPLHIEEAELQRIIATLRTRLERRNQQRARRAALDDEYLQQRALALNMRYFDGTLAWESIGWSLDQNRRWGSCSRPSRVIRISHRLSTVPEWVLEAVIVHELAHLVEGNHGPRFWRLANRFPLMERARGYLMALSAEAEDAM